MQDANFCIVCLGKDTHPINGSLNTGGRSSCSVLKNIKIALSTAGMCALSRRSLIMPSVQASVSAVFNVVVRSPDLAALRKQIFTRFVEAGGDGSRFSPVNIFAPHITLVSSGTNSPIC